MLRQQLEQLANQLRAAQPSAALAEHTVQLLTFAVILLGQHRIDKLGRCQFYSWHDGGGNSGIGDRNAPCVALWHSFWGIRSGPGLGRGVVAVAHQHGRGVQLGRRAGVDATNVLVGYGP